MKSTPHAILISLLLFYSNAFPKNKTEKGIFFNKNSVAGKINGSTIEKNIHSKGEPFNSIENSNNENYIFANYESIANEVQEAINKLCINKSLKFKLWLSASSGANVYIFSSALKGGLEVTIDCSKNKKTKL